MNLAAGEHVAWPAEDFRAKGPDLLASMEGVALFRLPADLDLPGLPADIVQRLGLELRATQDNSITIQPSADTRRGSHWLQQELQRQDLDTVSPDSGSTSNNLIKLLDALYQRRILNAQARVNSHTPLNSATATDLFRSLEQVGSLRDEQTSGGDVNQGLLQCIAAIRGIDVNTVLDVKHGPNDPRRRLQRLLEHNQLIGREVLMGEDDLNHDCGDLIAFFEEDGTSPAYLKSGPSGYQIWAPLRMAKPRSIWDCKELLSQLSPRMVAVNPALTANDLSTLGLLRFAFGKPNNLTRYIVSGLLIGLAVLVLGAIGYGAFTAVGFEDASAGIAAEAVLIVIVVVWTGSYLFRVVTGKMTYMEQRRRYREEYDEFTDAQLQERFDALSPEEQQALLKELSPESTTDS